jgi:uncharacterized protein (DUF427 family)
LLYAKDFKENHMKAIWNKEVIANSNDTVVVEGNHYFPPGSLNKQYFQASENHSACSWKGVEVVD